VLQYLARYTHRVAIPNHRLISLADGQVTFLWRDSAHNHEQKPVTLPLDKFLRRFPLHILPQDHRQTQKNPHQHNNWHEAGVGAQ
jgi:hypothetical protein